MIDVLLEPTEEIVYREFIMTGIFSVDSEGRVWRHYQWNVYQRRRYKLETPVRADGKRSRNGYKRVQVRVGRRIISCQAHRLVYRCFYGAIPDGFEVNHKNRVRWDNSPENLEILTPAENTADNLSAHGDDGRFVSCWESDEARRYAWHGDIPDPNTLGIIDPFAGDDLCTQPS